MRGRRIAILTACLTCACASGREPQALGPTRSVAGPVAAVVAGDPIALSEVEALCRASGLAPAEALSRLVAERLLVQHALAGGYDRAPGVAREVERAKVQALLAREVEAAVPEGEIEARRERLAALLATLARATPVRYDERAIQAAFASPSAKDASP